MSARHRIGGDVVMAEAGEQTVMWESPRASLDPTPLEVGGALIVMRLTPEEIELLSVFAVDMPSAIHLALARLPSASTESEVTA